MDTFAILSYLCSFNLYPMIFVLCLPCNMYINQIAVKCFCDFSNIKYNKSKYAIAKEGIDETF
jgi:hypothetical protein